MLKKLTAVRKRAQTAACDARAAIGELRALRARLLDELYDIEHRPVPLAEAQEAAEHAVRARAERTLAGLARASLLRPQDGRPQLRLDDNDARDLAFAAVADSVAEKLRRAIEAAYSDGPTPLSAEERERELARLDKELFAAEMAEEGLVRSLEREGIEIARRPDMDPRVLLAADEELK